MNLTRRLRRAWAIPLAACLSLLPAISTLHAGEAPSSNPSVLRPEIASEVKGLVERLNLTDEQKTKVEPILRESAESRRAVLEKYRGQRSLRSLRALKNDLAPIQKHTDAKLKTVLTPTQMKEFKKIRAELRERWRDEFRQQRGKKG